MRGVSVATTEDCDPLPGGVRAPRYARCVTDLVEFAQAEHDYLVARIGRHTAEFVSGVAVAVVAALILLYAFGVGR